MPSGGGIRMVDSPFQFLGVDRPVSRPILDAFPAGEPESIEFPVLAVLSRDIVWDGLEP